MIEVLVTTNNKLLIDATTEIITNSPLQQLCFTFQEPWPEEYKLYAVFKPVWDIPVSVELDENNCCLVPILKYNKYAMVGIALTAVDIETDTIVLSTKYTYVRVIQGASVPEFAPSSATGTHRYDTDDDSFAIIQGDSFDTKLLLAGIDDYSIIDNISFVSSGANLTKPLLWDVTQNSYRLYFSPEETSILPAGTYTYNIVITFTDGDRETVITNEEFSIIERRNS